MLLIWTRDLLYAKTGLVQVRIIKASAIDMRESLRVSTCSDTDKRMAIIFVSVVTFSN